MDKQRSSFHSKQLTVATQDSLLVSHDDIIPASTKTLGEHDAVLAAQLRFSRMRNSLT